MFPYLLCAMLILNAFVREGVAQEECKDRGSQSYCNMHKNHGDCDRTDYKFIMKANCRKTCNLCDE
ncbi:shTK domain protein [Teladorsagia circumcincta]|uniref:ShTK domain protein n=1 Tax=Teladorsagia circumcincta TaxID=45464 RepID=A0A2G9U393_TELCI|nr:shTK domain protein [Teladorsagia circumcincta]